MVYIMEVDSSSSHVVETSSLVSSNHPTLIAFGSLKCMGHHAPLYIPKQKAL
jgi:hypothetical protein